ncbi:MAG TPA: DUF559 domain-containing protein [Candidatus Pacearchaeota archaeon]|nr:DUF559 domain-containing protein [Candidatus Pacearchaeota archaeon]
MRKGTKHNKETRKKISDINKVIMNSLEMKKKLSKAKLGKKLSEEHKKKISMSLKKTIKLTNPSYLFKKGQKAWNKGIPHTSETIKKIVSNPNYLNRRKPNISKIGRKRLSTYMKNNNPMFNEISLIKMKNSRKKQWKNSKQYKKNWINSLLKTKPNKKEIKVLDILNNLNSNFKFVGNAKKWITGKDNKRFNPDFINEDKKMIIEFFGTYWHKDSDERDKLRIKAYQRVGYKVLIIKEEEIHNAKNMILNFTK